MGKHRTAEIRCLPWGSTWALAVYVGVVLGATGSGGLRNKVSVPTVEAKMVLPTLSGGEERAYGSQGGRRYDCAGLEMGKNGVKGKFSITPQRKSVA